MPLVYFIGTRPGSYKPVFPCFVTVDDPASRLVTVTPGELRGPMDDPAPVPLEDPLERRYAVRHGGDPQELGDPTVSNGLSLCAIHHRAFDQNLVGVSPDYVVHASRRFLEDEDGPMLDLLKGFHDVSLHVPRRAADRPDRERLDTQFAQFLSVAAA